MFTDINRHAPSFTMSEEDIEITPPPVDEIDDDRSETDRVADGTADTEEIIPDALDAISFYKWGMSKARKGLHQMALDYLSHSIEGDPSFAHAYLGRAFVHHANGRNTYAIIDSQKAHDLFVEEEDIQGIAATQKFINELLKKTKAVPEQAPVKESTEAVGVVNTPPASKGRTKASVADNFSTLRSLVRPWLAT